MDRQSLAETKRGLSFALKELLIFDSKKAHIEDGVKKVFTSTKFGVNLTVIPRDLTKILQPLDISINRSFKANKVQAHWEEWMTSGLKKYTKSRNVKKLSLVEVVQWVKNSWDSITIETVKSGLSEYDDYKSEDTEELHDDNKHTESFQTMLQLLNSDIEESDFDGYE